MKIDEYLVLRAWFLPKLFGFSSVKAFTDALDNHGSMGTTIGSPGKEYMISIKATGRERAVLGERPDLDYIIVREEQRE